MDQIFVGNGVGYLGNAATGVIFPITVIGWGMSLFFGDGAAAYLSVALGKHGVIVTISREHGSAGKRIGQLLAQMMQIPCYYKEVTAMAAEESGLAAEFISDINKNSPDRLKELYMSTNIMQQAVVAQDKIIKKIAESGSCVIIGRAADHILREHQDIVRIFIHAPKNYRVKKIMEMYGDTEQEAKKNMEHSDAARSNYYRSVTGLPWAHSDNYELCIDSSIGEQACAEMIYTYLEKKGYGKNA